MNNLKLITLTLLIPRIFMLDWTLTPTEKIKDYVDRENITLVCFDDIDNTEESEISQDNA